MLMKKLLLILFVITTFLPQGNAQLWKLRRLEVGGGPGTTQFYGDIGGYSKGENIIGIKDFSYLQTRWNINAYARYRFLEDVSARVNFNFGMFRATDKRGSNEARGLGARTMFFESSVLGEYYFIKNKGENSFLLLRGQKPFRTLFEQMDFYVFAGIGGIAYNVNPNARLDALDLKKSGFAPVIPFGLGTDVVYTSNISFGLELGGRFSFTYYLEGYTSVHSKANDVYYFFNFTITYKIKLGANGTPTL
jgi:hypothetical protein